MKYPRLLLSIFVISLLASCDCDKKYSCQALSASAREWLTQVPGDTVRFENGLGQHLTYVYGSKYITPEYEAQACQRDEIGCTCDYRCEATGSIFASPKPGNDLFATSGYSLTASESSNNNKDKASVIDYYVIDFSGGLDLINPTVVRAPYDTLYQDLQLGGTLYHQVHEQWMDTTWAGVANKKVWKIYFTKDLGVIGFCERELHSTFYRQ